MFLKCCKVFYNLKRGGYENHAGILLLNLENVSGFPAFLFMVQWYNAGV